MIGAMFGGARVGIVNFDKTTCPYRLKSHWRHSVRGKLEKDPGITMVCAKPPVATTNLEDDLHSAPSVRDSVTAAPDFIPSDNLEKLKAGFIFGLYRQPPSRLSHDDPRRSWILTDF